MNLGEGFRRIFTAAAWMLGVGFALFSAGQIESRSTFENRWARTLESTIRQEQISGSGVAVYTRPPGLQDAAYSKSVCEPPNGFMPTLIEKCRDYSHRAENFERDNALQTVFSLLLGLSIFFLIKLSWRLFCWILDGFSSARMN